MTTFSHKDKGEHKKGCAYFIGTSVPHCTCNQGEEKIEIVPSPRIDWCGDCQAEHGYECPKSATPPLEWERKKEMIEFLKHILPYWESDDLDDYMYVVHHYDLERVAGKIQELLASERSKVREAVMNLKKRHGIKYDRFTDEADLTIYNEALNDVLSILKKKPKYD